MSHRIVRIFNCRTKHSLIASPEDGLITTKTLLAQQGQYGWPELQIEILRECITVSEALPGKHFARFTTGHVYCWLTISFQIILPC